MLQCFKQPQIFSPARYLCCRFSILINSYFI